MSGYNGTILAYGQTSSGKTHTMQGADIYDMDDQGIIPRTVNTIFQTIERADADQQYSVVVSIAEIYKEKVKDLLDETKVNLKVLQDKSSGTIIQDLTECLCADEQEVYDLIDIGNKNKVIGSNNMNDKSSRSHTILSLTVMMTNASEGTFQTGRLYLVDLAGSERMAKTGAQGKKLEEAKSINLSLTTLGRLINAFNDPNCSHFPYRESKLTRILAESLGGNSKTCMIVTVSPHPSNDQETLSTLRYGSRAKNIKNSPKANLEIEVADLKSKMQALPLMYKSPIRSGSQMSNDAFQGLKTAKRQEQKIEDLENTVEKLQQRLRELGGSAPGLGEEEALCSGASYR